MSKHTPHTSTAPLFKQHYDGLGTFLDIAAGRIHEWAQNGQLQPCHIASLRGQCEATLYSMGSAVELLAMERIDYIKLENNHAVCSALMMAGRAMQEIAAIQGSLQMAETFAERQRCDSANSDEWPPC